ncbi:MAG: hypothetical protein ACOZIN_14220 [Myxococcota bacterium]
MNGLKKRTPKEMFGKHFLGRFLLLFAAAVAMMAPSPGGSGGGCACLACLQVDPVPDLQVTLKPVGDSGFSEGEAEFFDGESHGSDAGTGVVVSLRPAGNTVLLGPRSVHIHNGTCGDAGTVAFALAYTDSSAASDPFFLKGDISTGLENLRGGHMSIDVHAPSPPETTVVELCGDIP